MRMNERSNPMEYRCLLWDFDGTLADTGSDVWNSLTYAARRAGGAIDDLYMRDDQSGRSDG